jgi:hypothetical protein
MFKRKLGLMMAAIIVASVCAASGASAVTILQYGTAGSTTSLAPFEVNPAVAGTNLEAGSGLAVQTFSTFNFSDWDPSNASYADAVADDEVFTWGFTVTDALATIDLTTLDIRVDRSGTGPDDFEVRVAVNAGPETTVLTHDYGDTTSGVNFLGVDLSAISGLGLGDTVTFTLGAFNAESAAGTFDLETITFPGGNDSIVVSGDITVIPEPSTALLLGMGLAALGGRRRLR